MINNNAPEEFNPIRLLARVVIAEAFHEIRAGMSTSLKRGLTSKKKQNYPNTVKDPRCFLSSIEEIDPWAQFAGIPPRKLIRQFQLEQFQPKKARKGNQRKFKVKEVKKGRQYNKQLEEAF